MGLDATVRRRLLGVTFLGVALAMLIGGETVFKDRLGKTAFLAYWLGCFVFTFMAIVVALLDFRALQRRIRHEQRNLFQSTLNEIETDAKTKATKPDRAQRN